METIENILIPVDLSLGSRAAAQAAISLAKRYSKAHLTFLHVSEPTPIVASDVLIDAGGGRRMALQDYIREQNGQLFDDFLASLDGLVGVEHTRTMARGTPHSSILNHAEKGPCDLIVMGTHGRTGVSHFLLGSVAEKVVRHAPCPVLTVRGQA